jgi:hypothetical protein
MAKDFSSLRPLYLDNYNWTQLAIITENDNKQNLFMGDFFDNVSRYPRYLISFSLGIFFSFFGWLAPLLKNPVTAIALVGFLGGAFAFLYFTLKAMLGLA